MVASVLGTWLCTAQEASNASPTSRRAAILQQQLEGTRLLQHLPAILASAETILTDTMAEALSNSSSSSSSSSTDAQHTSHKVWDAAGLAHRLANVYFRAICVLSATAADPSFSLHAALPAALAAVRLILTTTQTISMLQQLASRENSPAWVLLLAGNDEFQNDCTTILALAHIIMIDIAQ
jgi:hypothetical protein